MVPVSHLPRPPSTCEGEVICPRRSRLAEAVRALLRQGLQGMDMLGDHSLARIRTEEVVLTRAMKGVRRKLRKQKCKT